MREVSTEPSPLFKHLLVSASFRLGRRGHVTAGTATGAGRPSLDPCDPAVYDALSQAVVDAGEDSPMLMDRKIFSMDLSVEATSAYILICSLVEGGAPATVESLVPFWNGPREALPSALAELRDREIIEEILDERLVRRYFPNPPDFWRPAGN